MTPSLALWEGSPSCRLHTVGGLMGSCWQSRGCLSLQVVSHIAPEIGRKTWHLLHLFLSLIAKKWRQKAGLATMSHPGARQEVKGNETG
jgi:hypothetical protein